MMICLNGPPESGNGERDERPESVQTMTNTYTRTYNHTHLSGLLHDCRSDKDYSFPFKDMEDDDFGELGSSDFVSSSVHEN